MNIVIETFGMVVTILAVVGVVYNNNLDRKCFYFWIASNLLSFGLHCWCGMFALALRDALFLVFAILGLKKWKRGTTAIRCDDRTDGNFKCMNDSGQAGF